MPSPSIRAFTPVFAGYGGEGALMTAAPAATLVLRLKLDQRGAVVVADPERGRCRVVVDEYAAHVGLVRQRVLGDLAGLQVEPQDAVGIHAGGPQMPVLGRCRVIGREELARHLPFLELLGLGV